MFLEIPLTQNKFALVDAEDYEYLMQWKWCAQFNGHTNSFYAARAIAAKNGEKRKAIRMHRLIMGLTDPKILVDHIDHNTLNNCRSNLRIATPLQNRANSKSRKNTASQYLGVSWYARVGKWTAQIQKDKKKVFMGYFENEHEAAIAYNAKASELFGEFANLNKIAV